jgi:hypothetical protein
LKGKLKTYLEEISLDLGEEKEMGCNSMLRIIVGRSLDIDEELYACFIDWQKASDRVKWSKLMQILGETGKNWCEGRWINKLYIGQGVKFRLDGAEARGAETCHRLYSK